MTPTAFEWRLPVDVRFGAGCSDGVAEALGQRSALLLAFEPAARLGLETQWRAEFGDLLVDWVTVPEGLSSLDSARTLAARVWPALAAAAGCVLVALGGGSTLDLAKVLRCRPVNGRFDGIAAALCGSASWPPLLRAPLWLLPTTAGTGSEVTRWPMLSRTS